MRNGIIILIFLVKISLTFAHPTGDMVFTNNRLLWSYVCPVDNIQHTACVMLWDSENGVRPWLTSEYSGSDWMISVADSKSVYLIERYYNQNEQIHFSRLLYSEVESNPTELIPWFRDEYRFGEHGFVVLDNNSIIFARYPNLYKFDMDRNLEIVADWKLPTNSIRNTNNRKLIIQSDSTIWLTDLELNVLETWPNLLEQSAIDLPFGGNRISDADFSNGTLFLSYWGKRRFEMIKNGKRNIIKSYNSPWVPHHIAVDGSKIFMLSSTIAPDITDSIEPSLLLVENGKLEIIWGASEAITNIKTGYMKNEFNLIQNFPNPFNPSTTIQYTIPPIEQKTNLSNNIKLTIYDIQGRELKTIVNNKQGPGSYQVSFDASSLSSGIYFYSLIAGDFHKVHKMLYLK